MTQRIPKTYNQYRQEIYSQIFFEGESLSTRSEKLTDLLIDTAAKQQVILDMLSEGGTRDFDRWAEYGQGVPPDNKETINGESHG